MLSRAARLPRLVDDVLHVPGREELPLLDVDRLAGRGHGADEIGLAAQEGRRLQHVDHCCRPRRFPRSACTSVSTGTPMVLRTSARISQTLVHAQAAERLAGAAVGLVVGGLEDEGDAELGADAPSARPPCPSPARAIRPRRDRRSGTAAGPDRLRSRRASWLPPLRRSAQLRRATGAWSCPGAHGVPPLRG